MRITFGAFQFDAAKRELTKEGAVVHLPAKAFRLLELLLIAAPAAVRREDLYEELWGGTFVEDANLPNLISDIRTALGETARQPRFIRTVHRFGYRFAAESENANAAYAGRYFVMWSGVEWPLHAGQNSLGRGRDVDIRVDLAGVSRDHAVITIEGGEAVIEDQGSKNGTYVGTRRIVRPHTIVPGDRIGLGSAVVLLFGKRSDSESTLSEASSASQQTGETLTFPEAAGRAGDER